MKTSALVLFAALLAAGPALASLPSTNPADPRPVPVIDMHAHVFNARDVPIEGIAERFHIDLLTAKALGKILRRWTEREPWEYTPAPAAAAVAAAPGPGSEAYRPAIELEGQPPLQLDTLEPEEEELLQKKLPANWWDAMKERQARFQIQREQDRLLESSPDSPVKKSGWLFQQQAREANAQILVAKILEQARLDPEEDIDDPAANAGRASADGWVRFVRLFTSNRTAIVAQLRETYGSVDLFVHHMMDMEKAYNATPAVKFDDQNAISRRLDREARGGLAHFTAFDPFRNDDQFESIKQAVRAGALGVKFYPPSGYRPAGNEDAVFAESKPSGFNPRALARWNSRYGQMNAARIDEVNEAFFRWAEDAQVPIFVHCTPFGFQAGPHYGERFAHPKYWESVLERHPRLRVCFGHAGGEFHWFREVRDLASGKNEAFRREFGEKVAELCRRYENVYCEIAYLEDVLTTKGREVMQRALEEEFKRPGAYPFATKIMYGSDWHQLEKVVDREEYLNAFNRVIGGIAKGAWQRPFFSGNAVRFLRLDERAKDPGFAAQRAHWEKILAAAK